MTKDNLELWFYAAIGVGATIWTLWRIFTT